MDLKVYALLNAKIKELTGGGGLTQEEVEKIVTNEVAKIVAGAPADFDTLKEMSDWISSHENSAAEMNSAIQTNTNDISTLNTNKVDKVEGKSLISDTEIERLANVDNYDDSGVRADIETNETNISTLAKHINGDLLDSDFQEDSNAVMTKTVPTGMSNYAAISKIGGKTVKDEENQVLKNAVVESVVSVGKNLCSGLKYGKGINTTNGTEYDLANAACTDFIPVKPSTTIYASGMGTVAANFITWYDANKNYIDRSGGSNNNLRSQVLPANARYVRLNWYGGVTLDMATNNTIMISYDKSAFIPYNKTTLLIPSEARNCVGYGLGISDSVCNIADFENGVYTQAVVKKKLKDITSGWGISSTDGYVYCSGITDKKAGLYNIIFSAFSNNPLASAGSLANGEAKANVSNETVYFMDNTCTTVSAFVSKYGESEVVYELKTPVTTPLKDFIRPLPVENGGTLTLVNEHNLDMPNSIMYKKEVSLNG